MRRGDTERFQLLSKMKAETLDPYKFQDTLYYVDSLNELATILASIQVRGISKTS